MFIKLLRGVYVHIIKNVIDFIYLEIAKFIGLFSQKVQEQIISKYAVKKIQRNCKICLHKFYLLQEVI